MSSVAGQFGIRVLIGIMLLLTVAVRDQAAEPNSSQPTFPRIGNCYGAGLGRENWEKGGRYWSKLGLIIGGCYDLHYDWEHARWPAVLTRVEQNLLQLRKVNPRVIVLPYVDVVEGPDILKVLPIVFSPGNQVYYGVGASLGHAFAVGKEI